MNNFNSPAEIIINMITAAKAKASMPLPKMIILGFIAGMFIALGGCAANVAAHAVSDAGVAKLISGAIFPVGLMMIVVIGGELFTGNCLMITGIMHGEVKWYNAVKNLLVVYFSNMLGGVFVALCAFYMGQFDMSGGLLGAYTIKIAVAKINLGFGEALVSGIFCNILVCAAVLMAAGARDIGGKILGIFFPIFAFVISGFEHCVANMYYIPAGIAAASNSEYLAKAADAYGIFAESAANLGIGAFFSNLLPVTIGNIIGGAVFMGVLYYIAHIKLGSR